MYLQQTHLQSAVVAGETSRVKMRLQVQILTHKQETERESTMGMVGVLNLIHKQGTERESTLGMEEVI